MKKIMRKLSLVLVLLFIFLEGCAANNIKVDIKETIKDYDKDTSIIQNDYEGGDITITKPEDIKRLVRINEGMPEDFSYYEKLTYDFVGDDVMPLNGWVPPQPTDENFAIFAQSGLNSVTPLGFSIEDKTAVNKHLRLCEKYGLNFFIHNDYATTYQSAEDMKQKFAYALESPAFGGIGYDEAGLLFIKELGLVNQYMQTFMSSKIFFFNNMGPSMAPISVAIGNTSGTMAQARKKFSEQKYGNAFIDSFDSDYLYNLVEGSGFNASNMNYKVTYQSCFDIAPPKMFSFDDYKMTETFPYIDESYYKTLSIGREYAKKNGVPFWNYIQVISMENSCRPLTEKEIMFQVNSNLSYGVKGLNYFLYNWNSGEDFAWLLPMVNNEGKKTDTYYSVQKANRQVALVDEILLNCLHKGVIQCGWSPAIIPSRDKLNNYGSLISAEGAHSIIGCFDYDADHNRSFESDVFYVTNTNLQNSATTKLIFSGNQNVEVIDGEGKKVYENISELILNQEPGGGALVLVRGV